MERFGVMLDCSRNAVMKPQEVKNFAKILIDNAIKSNYNGACKEVRNNEVDIKGLSSKRTSNGKGNG